MQQPFFVSNTVCEWRMFEERCHTQTSPVAFARTSYLHLFTCANLCTFGFAACHDVLMQLLAQILMHADTHTNATVFGCDDTMSRPSTPSLTE